MKFQPEAMEQITNLVANHMLPNECSNESGLVGNGWKDDGTADEGTTDTVSAVDLQADFGVVTWKTI